MRKRNKGKKTEGKGKERGNKRKDGIYNNFV
jgi:hypothetical protein